jgi:peptidoglycan/LPS O-acetylase OafA/YrhL
MGENRVSLAHFFNPRKGENSLNAMRLLFAVAVIVSHSWAVGLFGKEPGIGATTLGFWSVLGFFGISGYLITRSRLSGRPAIDYYRARALRIFPGLLVCLLLIALVLAPLSAVLDGSGGWSAQSAATFVLRNAVLYPPHFSQEGIGQTLQSVPYESMWNGSLWTLFWEGACYVAVGVAVSVFPRRTLPFGALIALLVVVSMTMLNELDVITLPVLLGRVLALVGAFLAGAVLMLHADRVAVNRYYVSGAVVVLLASIGSGTVQSIGVLPFVYLVMVAGSTRPLRHIGKTNDISYGLYIYAWPVQQFVMLIFGPDILLAAVIGLSIAGTVPLAYMSFRFIELPALGLKRPPKVRTTAVT